MTPVLTARDIRRSFGGVPAVDGVSFDVSPGEIVALIGPNGSGKSTTANIVTGALRCDEGRLMIGADDVTNRPAHAIARHGLARTFQIARVWGRMTVAENLLVAGTDHRDETITTSLLKRRHQRRCQIGLEARLREILDALSLSHLENERAEVLSGGQKRLLEFGRIMISGARVLVLDEPLAGINPVMVQALLDVMARFRDDGCAVLLIEHNLQAVEETSDRVIVMATGKVIAEGSLADVRTSEAVVSAYLGATA
jgi:ABC-type branched-subunit amino acid transport system ATPase component